MKIIYEIKIELPYVVKSKARPRYRKKNQVQYNPSKPDEEELLFDITNILTEDDIEFLKTIKDDHRAIIQVYMKNEYKTTNLAKRGTPKLTTPDIDNCLKLFMDAVNTHLWYDDRQVYKATSEKWYAQEDKSYIEIKYYQ